MPGGKFDGVYYYISETISLDNQSKMNEILDPRGATPVSVSDPRLTHFITSALALEDFVESLPDDSTAYTVTPLWVERSSILGAPQNPEYYSPDPAFLFSGVVAAATDLPKSDCEIMSAAINAMGGQWRSAFTRDVTHLFALAPGSPMYESAMHHQKDTLVRVLVPHWFDDTVRLGIRDLPTRQYEWPEPRVFQHHPEGRTSQEDVDYEPPPERTMLYDTASLSNDELKKLVPASRNIWKGKHLLLGLSLDLSDKQRKILYADITRQGGKIVELSPSKSLSEEERLREEVAKVEEADVFVTKYRSGAAYAKAYQAQKTIGTLAWLWYVRATGTLTRPADQLLHYPVPDYPALGFDKEVVTVTNYTGKDREYLKKLITQMGGEFTPSMSMDKNTAVVAAYLHGTKTDKATSWSIPIVNHTWVEDCFVQWRRLTPARDKYIAFPPGVDFSTVLAERGLGKITWEPGQLEEMQRMAEHQGMGNTPKKQRKSKSKSASASPKKVKANARVEREEPPPGTAQSAGEVEEAVAMDEDDDEDVLMNEDAMDVDAGPSKPASPAKAKHTREAAPEAPAKRKLVRRYTGPRTDDELEEQPAATPARDAATTPSPKRPTRTYGSAKARRLQRDAETESPSPVKKPPGHGKGKTVVEDEDVEMVDGLSEDEEVPNVKKGKHKEKEKDKEKKPPTKAKEKEQTKNLKPIELVSSDSDTDSSEDEMRSVLGDLLSNRKGKGRAAAPPAKAPQRIASVTVPTVASMYSSPSKQKAKTDEPPMKVGPPKKGAKKSAPTGEPAASRTSKAKKAARPPSPSESAASTPPPPAGKPPRNQASGQNAEAGSSRATSSTSPTKLMRTPSKRSAATKATNKLHNEIMPDLVSFQKELKKGAVRPAYEREEALSAKGQTPALKGRKRPSAQSGGSDDGEEEVEEEEEVPERKKRKTNEVEGEKGKGKKKAGPRKSNVESEEPDDHEVGPAKKSAGAAAGSKVTTSDGKDVRIMTTQLTLSDEVVRTLTKMGVKIVTKPADCTHLLVRNVVRTEKFLCAMAVAPHILGEKWAIMSAANRKLLSEAAYAIQDGETEKKYGFTLADALARAKTNAGKLFGGITFYVTPKVPVDSKLLKNVVAANGGQLLTQTPTVRILTGHDDRFVISCPEDVSIWRPLSQHHKIYTQELILTGALKQEVAWEDPTFQVTGSY